jgi:hypothetical protein
MPVSSAERVRAYRARQKASGLSDSSRKHQKEYNRAHKRRKASERPFVGCDGEGCGTDNKGRQLYMLFRMGERELFTGNPLATYELLDFICNAPDDCILVGFAFGYDVTMILRDLSEQQARRLLQPVAFEAGHSRYVWFKDFDLEYLPKNYFRVKRVKIVRNLDGSERRVPIKGSQRTIYETFGFFQKSFLNSIKSFDVGTDAERESIAANKARRSDFASIDQEERDYCAMECRFLAELMERLRSYCYAAGIVPRTWNGAGKLASALHALHHTPKRSDLGHIPSEVADYANMAYYGGRFEITRVGQINQPVFEYDICSAYPDAMRKLPCLIHGGWRHSDDPKSFKADGLLFVARVKFSQSRNRKGDFGVLGGLPVRTKEGHLIWPRRAGGIYWSVEIEAARRLGLKIQVLDGWIYEKACECQPFDWVEPLYDYRKSIGSQGAGYPIKLGINSLYGKLAQRKGNGAYHNMIWAGLITANTRAKLLDGIALAPGQIIMVATDALYSLVPLSLDVGERLGQWEAAELADLFIVQPGLYWSPDRRKKKSRGLSGNFFEQKERTQRFETEWHYWAGQDANGIATEFPKVTVPVPGFVGLKLALARNKHDAAGTWVSDKRDISFDYRNKRQLHKWCDGHIITAIKPGSAGLVSLPHRDFLKAGGQEAWEAAREMLEEQPDYIEFSAPFGD